MSTGVNRWTNRNRVTWSTSMPRTAIRMTSSGNRNPANADVGGWMGRMSRWYFIATASSSKGQGTNSKAAGRGHAQCNSAGDVASGRRCTRLIVVSAQGHDETFSVGNRHGQRRVAASSKSRWHFLPKMDANTRMAVRAKGQTVVSTRQASPDSRPPAVVLGQMRPDDVTQGSHDPKEAERRYERALVCQCDAVLRWSYQEWQQ